MKKVKNKTNYFFVDESGDPYFYDRHGNFVVGKEGCSKILILGFIRTENPVVLRSDIVNLQKTIKEDEYLKEVPSISKSLKSFHATDDCPEVRERVYKLIKKLNFKAEFIVARKIENIFKNKHEGKPNLFYDDLITKLFQNQLHSSHQNIIYFSKRTNRARQQPLDEAIKKAVIAFENKWKIKIESEICVYAQNPKSEFCLQIIDYVMWAVQRAYVKKESRYYEFIKEKISLIADIYDFDKFGKNYYSRRNPFNLKKMSPV